MGEKKKKKNIRTENRKLFTTIGIHFVIYFWTYQINFIPPKDKNNNFHCYYIFPTLL